eukprot:scaffold20060_cov33-Tisochrysis_lutea.AAC.1
MSRNMRLFVLLLGGAVAHNLVPSEDTVLERITFSSCAHQDPEGFGDDNIYFESWDTFAAAGADLAILTGDNVYGDCVLPGCTELKAAYDELAAIPAFQRFKSKVPFIATWDDHDYGVNNGGADFALKHYAKEHFLNFYNIPMDDERRTRGGVYKSYTFGPEGKRLQVILLDDRWFKTADTILGDEQWQWLAQELRKPADLRLLVNGFQFLGNLYEGFYQQPCEQKKLLSILPDNVVLISGDRHIGSFYQVDAMGGGAYGATFPDNNGNPVMSLDKTKFDNLPLLEVTASSLTHAWNEAGLEPGNNRIPGYDIVRTDHFGQIDINWEARSLRVSLVPSNTANTGAMPSEIGQTVTIDVNFPAAKAVPVPCPSGCVHHSRRLLFSTTPTCPPGCTEAAETCPLVYNGCDKWMGASASNAAKAVLPSLGTYPTDPLLYINPNVSVTPLMSSGEFGVVGLDSLWQIPDKWNGLAMVTGPFDGAGIQVLRKGLLRYYVNNEISVGNGIHLRYSATEEKGSPDQAFPSTQESFVMNGATIRYFDIEVEFKSSATKYKHLASGVAIKRIYISTDAKPEGELVTSVAHMKSLTGLDGLSRFCGGTFHNEHEFSHLTSGAGFEDKIYISGHEDGGFGGVGVLDVATGNTYLLPTQMMVETATPLYTGSADYVAMVVNIYPEPGVGQRVHLYYGKKVGTDFLGRNGLNPAYGQYYVLIVPGHETWDNMDALVEYAGSFVPVETATGAINSGLAKNEWSSVNKHQPTMWAQSMALGDISVTRIRPDLLSAGDFTTKNGVQLPVQLAATTKRLRLKDIDPIFGDPDGLYWSPRGYLMIAEDGSTGRLLRLPLDVEGNSDRHMLTVARVGDESKRTHLNSIPTFSLNAASQAEFTGIIPAGFFHLLGSDATPQEYMTAELGAREQYIVNLQLHSLSKGIISDLELGEGCQSLRVDIEPDPSDTAPALYAWKNPSYYNGKRAEYCAVNDCSNMRGDFVPGEVVRVSDFTVLEIWRGLAPGTYTDDLAPIIAESLSYSNLEPALAYAWEGVGYYNGKREAYCSANDCSGMRGPFIAGEVVLESDFATLEVWRGLAPGTYTDDLTAIIAESLSFKNMEPALSYVWDGVGYYNGKREEYCSANDCSAMRGPFIAGEIVLESDFAILEVWRGLAPGTYTDDLTAIIAESLSYSNMEPAGF